MGRLCIAATMVSVAQCLQFGAGIDKVVTLPEVKQVLEKPQAMYQDLRSHVGSFEDQLLEVQRHNEESISKLKAKLETNLTAQKSDNRALEAFNTNLTHEISSLNKDIKQLREKATKFDKTNAKLLSDLKTLKGNMTTAAEFLTHALNASDEMLNSAPELEVLQRLSQLDDERAVEKVRQQRLQEVHISLLEVSGAPHKKSPKKSPEKSPEKDVDAHELLELMSTALAELAEEENASELALMAEFEREYAVGAYRTAELKAKQQELNTTKAAAIQLKERLADATQHLSDTNNMLLVRDKSIRLFSQNMAGNQLSGSGELSLLQTGAKVESLPGMKSVLEKPDTVYKSMTEHVSSLGEQLEEVNAQGVGEAEQEKKEFDEQIKKLEKNNTRQMHENEKVERDIKLLDMNIASLRVKADLLMNQNKIVRADMKGVQDNIALVQEFLLTSLEKSDENSSNVDELMVLGELATQDAANKQELAHKKSLDIIAKKQDKKTVAAKTVKAVKRPKSSKLSFLQMVSAKKHGDSQKDKKDKKDDKGASAHDLMAALASNLEQLMAEQAESQATIKASFEEESNALLAKHEELVEEWNTLNVTRAAKTEVESRLKVAISHLDKVHKSLSKRHVSLLNFGRKLANRPNPLADQKGTQENLMQASGIATNATDTNNNFAPLAWAQGLAKQLR